MQNYTNAESTVFEYAINHSDGYSVNIIQITYDNKYGTINDLTLLTEPAPGGAKDYYLSSISFELNPNYEWVGEYITTTYTNKLHVTYSSNPKTATVKLYYGSNSGTIYPLAISEIHLYYDDGSISGKFGSLLSMGSVYAALYNHYFTFTLDFSTVTKLKTRTITFNSNGGSSCDSIEVQPDTAYGTLPTPTRTGYTFAGWYTNSNLSGSPVTNETIVTENHTLYAKWNLASFIVALDPQGGIGGTSYVNATYTQTMPTATAPTRAGYSFGGYYTEINGGGTQYYTSTMASARSWDLTEDAILYAKWTINPYTITIQSTAGGAVSITGGTYNFNENVTSIAIAEAEKAFLYWVRASDNAQITENPLNQVVSGTETYTAVFGEAIEGVAVTSTIGGSAEVLGDDFDGLASTDTITLVARIKLTGYQFDGWYVSGTDELISTNMSVRINFVNVKNKLIIAKFTKISTNNINDSVNNT